VQAKASGVLAQASAQKPTNSVALSARLAGKLVIREGMMTRKQAIAFSKKAKRQSGSIGNHDNDDDGDNEDGEPGSASAPSGKAVPMENDEDTGWQPETHAPASDFPSPSGSNAQRMHGAQGLLAVEVTAGLKPQIEIANGHDPDPDRDRDPWDFESK